MTTDQQTFVKSKAVIAEDFLKTVNFLASKAGARVDVTLGRQPREITQLQADHTDVTKVREAFSFKEIDEQLENIEGDDAEVGTVGDIAVLAIQSDLQAKCIRASMSRHSSRAQRKLAAAYRLKGHAANDGMWRQIYVDKLQSILGAMQS
jgi:hypothetical protein